MFQFAQTISSEKKFNFVGKMPGMSRAAQEVVDPYIGGFLPASEIAAHLQNGAFRAGLVGVVDGVYYRVVATRRDLAQNPGWDETAWDIVSIGRQPPIGLDVAIL